MFDVSRINPLSWFSFTGVRGWVGWPTLRFWPTPSPSGEGTQVNYETMRALYRNDGPNALGAGFARPIVDIQVGFMGIPIVATDNENTNDFLNECLTTFWTDDFEQMLTAAIRDSKCVVRLSKPDVLNALMTLEESRHGRIEILPPERVDIERSARNKDIIERAVIHHKLLIVEDEGSIENGRDPTVNEHNVIEIIDKSSYRFYDQTDNKWLTELNSSNSWNFIPLLEVYNEYDSALKGGQSDLETVIPFINAFHDVLTQGLQAHAYHSTPKVVMKMEDSAPFIKMNFPEAVDENGELKIQGELSWRGREILFVQREDTVEFLEAQSVLGDSHTMAEFLIDCICIASQTPEWAFMRVDAGSANSDRNAQTVPLIKKIERKRRRFEKYVQELLKMILVANDLIPVRARLRWEMIRVDDQVVFMQAFQQLVMGLEVAVQRGEISDQTYRQMIRGFLPAMQSSTEEKTQAQKDQAAADKRQQALMPVQTPFAGSQGSSGSPRGSGTPVVGGPQGKNE